MVPRTNTDYFDKLHQLTGLSNENVVLDFGFLQQYHADWQQATRRGIPDYVSILGVAYFP
jgi:hypothetical protein